MASYQTTVKGLETRLHFYSTLKRLRLKMLLRSEWIVDKTKIYKAYTRNPVSRVTYTWQEYMARRPRSREIWLFDVIELLLQHRNWSGAYMLIKSFIAARKAHEGNTFWNRTPDFESPRTRATRLWFLALAEKYGYTMSEEDEEAYNASRTEQEIAKSRNKEIEDTFPFVGGKPKRRHSESCEFMKKAVSTAGVDMKWGGRPRPKAKTIRELEWPKCELRGKRVKSGHE